MKFFKAYQKEQSVKFIFIPVAAFMAFQILTLPSQASAAPKICAKLFRTTRRSAEKADIALATGTALRKTLPIAGRYSFADILNRGRQIDQVLQSPDNRLVAIVHAGPAPLMVEVVDLQTGLTVFSEGFTKVNGVYFIPDSELIAIDGTKKADGRISKLYTLPIEKTETKVAQAPATANPGNNLMDAAARFWLGPFAATSPAVVKNTDSLKLPGSPNWGVGVAQVVARKDLRYVFVVQDSSNALKTVYLPDTPRGADPHSSLLNQGAYLFDPKTMNPMGSLNYGDLAPIDMTLNPRTKLAALTLVDPIVAHRQQNNVVIVDTDQPQKPLYTYVFAETGVEHNYGRYTQTEHNQIATQWSVDGQSLFIVESTSGTVVKYDIAKGKETASERNGADRWPISGSAALSDGSILVLRQGNRPMKDGNDKRPAQVFGYITSAVEALSQNTKPDFELKFDPSPELFQRYHSQAQPDMIQAQAVFEMQNGRMIVVVLDGQVIAIDRDRPQEQIALNPPPSERFPNRPIISSVKKINESILRLSDREHGVFDLAIGAP
jgi:hypothetical protein